MTVPIPIYNSISDGKIKCSLCGRISICRKLTDYYRNLSIRKIKPKDWVCFLCEIKYIHTSKYAEEIYG